MPALMDKPNKRARAEKVLNFRSEFVPHKAQQEILLCPARNRIVVAGRRFGKTKLALQELIETSMRFPNTKCWYLAPTYKAAKEIAWTDLKRLIPKGMARFNEAELKAFMLSGSEIGLKGVDKPESLVGSGLKMVVMDEAAQYKEEVWSQIVRPMLMDQQGRCLMIGTPRGFNWFYRHWCAAETDPDWGRFHFSSLDNTAPEVVESIQQDFDKTRRDSDEAGELHQIMFRQELLALFEILTGRARFNATKLRVLAEKTTPPTLGVMGLREYHPPTPTTQYLLGADTAEGLATGDKSACVIVDAGTFSVVAAWHGTVSIEEFAHRVAAWGERYNNALAVVEDNNHGLAMLNELKRIYHNLYHRQAIDEHGDINTRKLGFRTSARTKPWLIAYLDKCINQGLAIPDRATVDELMTYVITEDGGTEAQEGCHDDLVMALACAMQGYKEYGLPFEQEKEEVLPRYCFERSMRGASIPKSNRIYEFFG